MHLLIANHIANHFSIQDKLPFLLGGVVPDAVSPKELSHFFVGDPSDYSRSIDYEAFIQKYNSHKHSNFILGYYTHLIADDLWLKGFFLSWLKNRLDKDKDMLGRYHNDFRLLNGKLLRYYNFSTDLIKGIEKVEYVPLQEVKVQDIETFLPDLLEDLNYEPSSLQAALSVFTFEQIVGYIETSVDKGTRLMNDLIRSE
ncbi:zinc dependent phospholipase C family protein [Paenibacillus sp. HJGM_3]